MDQYYVYILTDEQNGWLYTGYTNNLKRRVKLHRNQRGGQFTKKYNVHKLVYFELLETRLGARRRESEIKRKAKSTKIKLITTLNPDWLDLFDEL